jgi:oligopeptide/dipeptide ABC transporter ATP-binding protein
MTGETLLDVSGLTVAMAGKTVVEDVGFRIARGETLALVGESGCGKSVTALAIMGLLPRPPAELTAGRIALGETDLVSLGGEAMRRLRGRRIGMIFQEPLTALNPVFSVGDQIAEALRIHQALSAAEAAGRTRALIARVGLPNPAALARRYPHELSGGQRQRVVIAIALANSPELLIADEPTTALDVTVQAQILALIDRLRRESGQAVLLITHDLGVVAEFCDRVAVMYAGRIVEEAAADRFFAGPRHRYSRALLDTFPALNPPGAPLPAIPGRVPPPGARSAGCAFAARCSAVQDRCRAASPPLQSDGRGKLACWNPVA